MDTNGSPTPGETIKALREAKGLTRAALAALVDLNPQYIYQIETGVRHPKLETLWDLAVALEADPHSFDERLASKTGSRK